MAESLTRVAGGDYFSPVPPNAESPDDAARQRRVLRMLGRAFVSADSYGLVIVLIVVTYAFMVSVDGLWPSLAVIAVQLVTVWFAFRTSQVAHAARIVGWAIGGACLLAVVGQLLFGAGEPRPSPLVPFASVLLYLAAVVVIVKHIVARPQIDLEAALGAIAAYMCLGLLFAFLYRGLGLAESSAFFGANGDGKAADDLFFSMTTLTTTGYGNLVPAGNPGQSFAVLEMMTGQLFLLAAVGKVLAELPSRRRAAGSSPGTGDEEPRENQAS